MKKNNTILAIILLWYACNEPPKKGSFAYDLELLNQNEETVVLKNNNNQCQVVLVPAYQGRVMTSTARGLRGRSYGWINHGLIESKEIQSQINAYGGEDRFWLGPEGGQFSLFFKKGDPFTLSFWNTPKEIDTAPFALIEKSSTRAVFEQEFSLNNYQDYTFRVRVNRTVSILDEEQINQNLGIAINDKVAHVAFQSENVLTNLNTTPWNKEKGLLSIWILGMFIPSEHSTVIIPYKDSLALNTNYFGPVASDRLKVKQKTIFFKTDGKYRSKIGLPPKNALPVFGSYDAKNKLLTVVQYTLNKNGSYVNSLWKQQIDPYSGDVINSYNDGPLKKGGQIGPFYELETSSYTKALNPNETLKHTHITYHFEGEAKELNIIANKVLGVNLNDIEL